MSCTMGVRGTWFCLATMLADDEGMVYAYKEDDRPVPYGMRELAAELRLSDSSLRGHLSTLLQKDLLAEVKEHPGVYQLPRFERKAGQSRRSSKTRAEIRNLAGKFRNGDRRRRGGFGS